ncbi:MAG: vanadium-dependent haloperoxidase [Bacteroidota bacterium]
MKAKIGFVAILILLTTCSKQTNNYKRVTEDPVFIHRSIKTVTDRIVHDIFSPPVASRIYAYVSVAGYEAGRHADPNLVSLGGQLNGLADVPQPETQAEYAWGLAATQAVLATVKAFIFTEAVLLDFHEDILQEYRQAGIPQDVFDRSVAYGNKVAAHIIAWSSKDNYKQSRSFPKYSIQQSPSTWKPTPPAYMDAVEPHWNKIRTFAIDSASQFRCSPPPAFSQNKNSEFFKIAKEVYDVGKNLSEEQEGIARFWDCNPFVMNVRGHVMYATKKISPGGHWMNIVRVASKTANAKLGTVVEAYVYTALCLADGFIACWDEKYRSLLVRPETFINENIDPNWTPLLQTPPFPEYISGHSVISAAAATGLTHVFGDNFAFTDSTEVEFRLGVRSFKSFNDASGEAAVSRLYGGIHYRQACEVGTAMGTAVGTFISANIHTRRQQ